MPVFVKFCRFIFKIKGWKLVRSEAADSETLSRCVMIAAPHTTNWDAIYTIACFDMMGINWRFTLKKEWLKPPFG
ncbi:MAG: acyltransferase, partial [Bernardetiaceae bacterium]|nr:acyltransferase [Bernardetiaceae bacterium]